MKTAVAFRHIEVEDLGILDAVFEHWDFAFCYAEAGAEDLADAISPDPDLLVVLGGPMGVYESDTYPFLEQELAIIRARLASGKPMLGICLGAQLIAHAAGAKVYKGPELEIGYGPITLTPAGAESCLLHMAGAQYNVLHWHGDTFDLPAGAERLCSSPLTPNQGFAIGRNVLGLQFHVEVTPKDLDRWIASEPAELAGSTVDLAALRTEAARVGPDVAVMGARAIDAWLSQLEWPEAAE